MSWIGFSTTHCYSIYPLLQSLTPPHCWSNPKLTKTSAGIHCRGHSDLAVPLEGGTTKHIPNSSTEDISLSVLTKGYKDITKNSTPAVFVGVAACAMSEDQHGRQLGTTEGPLMLSHVNHSRWAAAEVQLSDLADQQRPCEEWCCFPLINSLKCTKNTEEPPTAVTYENKLQVVNACVWVFVKFKQQWLSKVKLAH